MKKAILFMLLSTLSFTGMNLMIKHLEVIPTFQIVFFRALGTVVLASIFLLKNGIHFLGNNRKLLVFRAFFGVTAMTLFFMSLKELEAGTAVSIRYIAPVFASIIAVYFLKEKLRAIQLLLFAIAFAGVMVIKGFDPNINLKGLALALAAAFFTGFVYIFIRKIGKGDHYMVIVNYFMVFSLIIGGILAINEWVNPSATQRPMLLSLGVFGYFGQIYMTQAFQLAKTNVVAPLKYMEVVFTILISFTWLGAKYTTISLVGVAMIIGALIINTLIKKA